MITSFVTAAVSLMLFFLASVTVYVGFKNPKNNPDSGGFLIAGLLCGLVLFAGSIFFAWLGGW